MDEIKVVEKTSRWTDDEREKQAVVDQVGPVAPPAIPPWVGTFEPGTTFTHEGWTCVVRHIGCEAGQWLMLVEPTDFRPPRAASRSEFKRLKTQVGKKEARRILEARGLSMANIPAILENEDAGA
jgi:hypothetical protein